MRYPGRAPDPDNPNGVAFLGPTRRPKIGFRHNVDSGARRNDDRVGLGGPHRTPFAPQTTNRQICATRNVTVTPSATGISVASTVQRALPVSR